MISETYPSGRAVNTTYDGLNRPNSVSGTINGQNTGYITQTAYWPHGDIYYHVRGNGIWYAASYNNRLQQTESYEAINNSGSQMLFVSCPDWGSTSNPGVYDLCPHPTPSGANNGNLQRYTEYHGGPGYPQFLGFGQSFAYDGVNRLKTASDSGWTRSFDYDQYGNMWLTETAACRYPETHRRRMCTVRIGSTGRVTMPLAISSA